MFHKLERCALKKAAQTCNCKDGKFASVPEKRNLAENLNTINHHHPTIGSNPNFLAYSNGS
jgi:hypothetical protein